MNFAAQTFKMKSFAVTLLFISMFSTMTTSCKKETSLAQQDYMNVAYGTDAAQKMDVYLPPGRTATNTKVIVFVHGGSWNAGDKADFNEGIAAIRSSLNDYAIFNINYRLAANAATRFPAQLNDIKSAIDFITTKGSEYNVNTNKIILIGASAGANLALLHAYKNNNDGRIKAVIDLFGPTELVDMYNNHPFPQAAQPLLQNFLGGTPTTNAAAYVAASPINFVNGQSVPTQIFHGMLDAVVPIAQSTALKNRLQAANVKVEMVVYQNEGHGWYGTNLLDTYAKATAFIKQNVQ